MLIFLSDESEFHCMKNPFIEESLRCLVIYIYIYIYIYIITATR